MTRVRRVRFKTPPQFVAWDGEGTRVEEPTEWVTRCGTAYVWQKDGKITVTEEHKRYPQPYVLLACGAPGIGHRIIHEAGLPTKDCLEFILQVKQTYRNTIFVGFGFNYDVNQILKDLPDECLYELHEKNETCWGPYKIKWLPRKSFYIKHGRSGRSAVIYDVFGFFQTSFLQACREYIGKDDERLIEIEAGKAGRDAFEWSDLKEIIIPYNRMELVLLVEMMDKLRADFEAAGIFPSRWHGPGAIAGEVLGKYGVKVSRDIPKGVLRAAQWGYAGGRFEQFQLGRHADLVYEYDIRSAYPAAIANLPDLSAGSWEHVESWEPGTFGIWRCDYQSNDGLSTRKPQPLFRRSQTGSVSYPPKVHGWYWTPEASLVPSHIREGYVFRPISNNRPFAFVEKLYEQRRLYKSQGISTQRALKLILNSLYGKLAQTIGGKDGPPSWHQLEWAGYITSTTRAKIYEALMLNPNAVIATETDAVFSTEPLDLPLSDRLGDWEQTIFKSIVYLQSGFYYADTGAEILCKYRGMDRDRETKQPIGLPYRSVLDHLRDKTGLSDRVAAPLTSYTTRYVGLGLGLGTNSVWRSWETKPKTVILDQNPRSSKRFHLSLTNTFGGVLDPGCHLCDAGISLYQQLHPTQIGGEMGFSYRRALPWVTREAQDADQNDEEWLEENPDFRYNGEDQDRWQ